MFVVGAEEIRRLIPMRDAIAAVRDAFVAVVDGSGDQPARSVSRDGTALAMVAKRDLDGGRDGTAFKLLSISKSNPAKGLPAIQAVVVWFDGESHKPHLLAEGACLTSLRTGAATGIATDLLAERNASTLAMIGAGGQAADQVRAVCAVRPISAVRICSLHHQSAVRLAERLRDELKGRSIEAVASPAQAVQEAGVICCATDSLVPVIPANLSGARVHINAIGSYRPSMHELPPELLQRSTVIVVDQVEAAIAESGEIIDAIESGALKRSQLVELGQLISHPPTDVEGTTVFKSVGIALQDWAICRLLSERLPAGARHIDI